MEHDIIDDHVHLGWFGINTGDQLIAHMDKVGIKQCWLSTWEAADGGLDTDYTHFPIEKGMRAHEEYPDRILPFYAVDPRREDAEGRLREFVKRGVKGYGELKLRLCCDHPDLVHLFRVCGELGLPVLIHFDKPFLDGKTPCHWYGGDMDALERTLGRCPDTTFVGHGPGFWRHISGDEAQSADAYPKGQVAPGGQLLRLLESHSNLYCDLSAGSGLNALTRDHEFGLGFLRDFSDRALYGTDDFETAHRDYLLSLELTDEERAAIFAGNAARLVSS